MTTRRRVRRIRPGAGGSGGAGFGAGGAVTWLTARLRGRALESCRVSVLAETSAAVGWRRFLSWTSRLLVWRRHPA